MGEDDKQPESMWEATIKHILENFSRHEIQVWKERFPELFQKYEEKHHPERVAELPPPSKPKLKKHQKPIEITSSPKLKVVPKQLTCKRCNHIWTPRHEQPPIQCPKCKSPYWNRDREKKRLHNK